MAENDARNDRSGGSEKPDASTQATIELAKNSAQNISRGNDSERGQSQEGRTVAMAMVAGAAVASFDSEPEIGIDPDNDGQIVELNKNGKPIGPQRHSPATRLKNFDFNSIPANATSREVLLKFADGNQAGANNLGAFLDTLAYSEGTMGRANNGYLTLVGGKQYSIDQYAKGHPGEKVYLPSINNSSSAFGRYQFLKGTYAELQRELGLKGITPASQDAAALRLIERAGALDDIIKGDPASIQRAMNKCRRIWASLPGAGYGQHEHAMSKLTEVFAARQQKYAAGHPTGQKVASSSDHSASGQSLPKPTKPDMGALKREPAQAVAAPQPGAKSSKPYAKVADATTGAKAGAAKMSVPDVTA